MKKHNYTPEQIKAISDSLNADMNMDNWECFLTSKDFNKKPIKEKASAITKYNYWAAKAERCEEKLREMGITSKMEREYVLGLINNKNK